MKKKFKIILGVIILAGLVGGFYFLTSKPTNNEKPKETTVKKETKKTEPSKEEEKVTKNEDFSREGAVKATEVMLKELQKSPVKDLTLEQRATEVASGKYDKKRIFTDEGWKKLRLTDFMEKDPRGAVLSAQSMLSVINSIEQANNKSITPTAIDYSGAVYFDKEVKTAYVPVDLYTNSPTNRSFEMVYVDGQWVLQPYSLIAQIAIRNMNKVTADKTPEGKTESAPSKIEEKNESKASSDSDDKKTDKSSESKKASTTESKK